MKKKIQSPLPPSQVDLLMDLLKKIQSEKKDKSEIMAFFQRANLLTKKGNFPRQYSHLAKVVKKVET
jgi:hypothetical protein